LWLNLSDPCVKINLDAMFFYHNSTTVKRQGTHGN
jgi:hypothetical protein